MKKLLAVVAVSCLYPYFAIAENTITINDEIDIGFGGFIRADLGVGDRYGKAHDDDRLGVSKAAFAVTTSYKNIQGVFVLGSEVTSVNNSTEDGNIDIKDAFVIMKFSPVDLIVGAQPLLFGLKPQGYPGDHSIQGSVEYGAGGAFAISNQAGPAVVANWNITDSFSLRGGFFDHNDYQNSGTRAASDPLVDNGSGIFDNLFIQLSGKNILGTGIYANTGIEKRYVGDSVDDSENIFVLGAGWKNAQLDFSAEYQALDKTFIGTAHDENYFILESSYMPNSDYRVYLDYSAADELDLTTWRLGGNYHYNKHTMFTVEYARDDADSDDVDSVDARVTLSF
ncbi:MAG: hypothetical protein V3W04_01125 [Gammaproteobacteria bacterium]